MTAYSIAHGDTKAHAARLRVGLATLPQGFAACICEICDGRGEYEQTYTHGCGRGYYRAVGGCDYCDGTGLLQGQKAAPDSVRMQVLNAAERAS